MKGWTLSLTLLLLPALAGASPTGSRTRLLSNFGTNHTAFSTFSQAATLAWGCPVADLVEADSAPEALRRIRMACIEEVSRAAASRPDVMTVFETRIIRPEIDIEKRDDGFHLRGTFFLETLVEQRTALEFRQ